MKRSQKQMSKENMASRNNLILKNSKGEYCYILKRHEGITVDQVGRVNSTYARSNWNKNKKKCFKEDLYIPCPESYIDDLGGDVEIDTIKTSI